MKGYMGMKKMAPGSEKRKGFGGERRVLEKGRWRMSCSDSSSF